MGEESKKKDQLLSIISLARGEECRLLKEAQKEVENIQYNKEISAVAETIIRAYPNDNYLPPNEWDMLIRDWDNYSTILTGVTYTNPMIETMTDSTSATMINIVFENDRIQNLPPPAKEIAQQGIKQFRSIIERRPLQEGLIIEMKRVGLDNTYPGNRSAISLLEEAVLSIQRPTSENPSPTSVLIPIRGAIERTLADLLPKRPRQEPTKNYHEKVKSILIQCGRDGITTSFIDQLADQVGNLHNKLSSAKGQNLTPHAVSNILTESELFLRSFLKSIDDRKLKK